MLFRNRSSCIVAVNGDGPLQAAAIASVRAQKIGRHGTFSTNFIRFGSLWRFLLLQFLLHKAHRLQLKCNIVQGAFGHLW